MNEMFDKIVQEDEASPKENFSSSSSSSDESSFTSSGSNGNEKEGRWRRDKVYTENVVFQAVILESVDLLNEKLKLVKQEVFEQKREYIRQLNQ
jgi:hypothetical protein